MAVGGVGGWFIGNAFVDGSSGMAPGYVVISFVLVFFLSVAVHEMGHLLLGKFVGFHFRFIQVGPLSLRLEYGRLKIRIHRGLLLGGFAGIQADRVCRLRRRLLIFILGGPAANLLSIPLTVMLVNYVFPELGRSWVAVPVAQFAFISMLLFMTSFLLQRRTSDGGRVWMLLNSRESARRWVTIFAFGALTNRGVPAKFWKRSWLSAVTRLRDGSRDEFVGNWLAYASANDRKDASRAAAHLERCLELARSVSPSILSLAVVEAAVFTAWFRNDALMAEKWAGKLKQQKQAATISRIRLQTALLCSRGDFEGAVASWREGLQWLEGLPPTASNGQIRDSWREWLEEIEERRKQSEANAVLRG